MHSPLSHSAQISFPCKSYEPRRSVHVRRRLPFETEATMRGSLHLPGTAQDQDTPHPPSLQMCSGIDIPSQPLHQHSSK